MTTCLGGQLREAFSKRRKSVRFSSDETDEQSECASAAVLRECDSTARCPRSRTEEFRGILMEKSESLRFFYPRQSSKSISQDLPDSLATPVVNKEGKTSLATPGFNEEGKERKAFLATEGVSKEGTTTEKIPALCCGDVRPLTSAVAKKPADSPPDPSTNEAPRQTPCIERAGLRPRLHPLTPLFNSNPLTPLLNSQAYQLNLRRHKAGQTEERSGKSLRNTLVPRCHTVTAGSPTDKWSGDWNPFQEDEASTGWPLKSVLLRDASSDVPVVHRDEASKEGSTILLSPHDLVPNPALVAASWSAHDWMLVIQAAAVGIRAGEGYGISHEEGKEIQQLLHQLTTSPFSSASPSSSSSSSSVLNRSSRDDSTDDNQSRTTFSTDDSQSRTTFSFSTDDAQSRATSSTDDAQSRATSSTDDAQSRATFSSGSEHSMSQPLSKHSMSQPLSEQCMGQSDGPGSCFSPSTALFSRASLPSDQEALSLGEKLTPAHRESPGTPVNRGTTGVPPVTPDTPAGSSSSVCGDSHKENAEVEQGDRAVDSMVRMSRAASVASADSFGVEYSEPQVPRNAAAQSSERQSKGEAPPAVTPRGDEPDSAQLMDTILQAHDLLLEDQSSNGTAAASFLLEKLLELTCSDMGFIASSHIQPDGSSMLKTHAITNVGWTPELRQWYTDNQDSGLVYNNNEMPFGFVNIPSEATIINDAASSSCYKGVPAGHPEVNSFLAVPLFAGEELVGVYGAANRKLEQGLGGYSTSLVESLKPFTRTVTSIVASISRQKACSDAYSEYGTDMSSAMDAASEGCVDTQKADVTRPAALRVSSSTTYEVFSGKSGFFASNRKPLW